MVDLLERAIARVNVREKTAALSMGMDPGQFSRSKHPDGSLALQKVGRLPVDVLDEFAALLADARGLLVRRRDARERRVQRITALQRELLALMDEDVRDRTEVAS